MLAGAATFILILLATGTVMAICVAIIIWLDVRRQRRAEDAARLMRRMGHVRGSL